MDSELVQISGIFVTITLLISSFVASLTIPYLLNLWNTFYREVDTLYRERAKLASLQKDAKKLKTKLDIFAKAFLRMVLFVTFGFCIFCFFFGTSVLAGWIKVSDNISLYQVIFGLASGGVVGYAVVLLALLWTRIGMINRETPVNKTIKLCGYIGLILLFLSIMVLTKWIFSQFASNVKSLLLTILNVEVVLLCIIGSLGQVVKPAKIINEFRLKILKGLSIFLSEEKEKPSIKRETKKMKKKESKKGKWNMTKLIVTGGLAMVYLVLALSGSALQAIMVFPGAAGIIMVFISAMMFAFCCLLIRQFGCATLMGLIYSIAALPLPTMGTPGFLPKILIGVVAGVAADSMYYLLRKNPKVASIGIGAITQIIIPFMIIGLGWLLSMPGIEKFIKLFFSPMIIPVTIFVGGLSGYVGYLLFSKLKYTSAVKRIQEG